MWRIYSNLPVHAMVQTWLNRRNEMGKIISDKYASKDDPIFTGRYTVSNPKANLSKPKKLVKKTQETSSFIKRGKNNE